MTADPSQMFHAMPSQALRSPSVPQQAARPTLRIYDGRLSRYLVDEPNGDRATVANVDLAGWIEGRRPLVATGGNPSVFYRAAKRMLDVVGAVVLLVLLSPLIVPTWLTLLVTTRGRPIFRQTRVGVGGRRFEMLKFRSMRLDATQLQSSVRNEQTGPVFKSRIDPRVTRLGAIMRKLSIDELPQLINVLRGDMSLVGPRPPIPAEVAKYEPWQALRLSVTPGLTCLWQVSGRCEIEFEDWVRLDLWYVRHQSLSVDLWLLLRTPWSVLSCRGAY